MFKEFIAKGDVLDLAVGVVFTAIVNEIVKGSNPPLIVLVLMTFTREKYLNGVVSILDWTFVPGVTFALGDVVSAVIIF